MYSLNKNIDRRVKLTEGKMNLIKFFITSNQSLSVLENEWFRLLVNPNVDISSYHYFRNFFLKEVTDMVSESISEKLNRACNVTLIPDIWKYNGDHYLGLGATAIFNNFDKQILILGMKEVFGNSAEHIKPVIQELVDNFVFDKRLARSNYSL
jgi:hypothetical protein